MPVSPFEPFKNSLLTFQVSSGSLIEDALGNMRPGTAVVEVEAILKQVSRPNVEPREGVDTTAIFLDGYIVSVAGAEAGYEQLLPGAVTQDSPCAATWQGRTGRFWMEFTAPNPYVRSQGIYFVDKLRGWFEPSSFVVAGDPWIPEPLPVDDGTGQQYTADLVAGIPISALRMVTLNESNQLIYADSTILAHAFKLIGISLEALTTGQSTQILTDGSWSDGSWNWDTSKPIWLGVDGVLTQTPPNTGFIVQVAIATTATSIDFEIQEPVIL